MSDFMVTGNVNPILKVAMARGEKIYANASAMIAMDETIDLYGKMRHGFFRSWLRKKFGKTSFFQQEAHAKRGDGEIMFGHPSPGGMEVISVGSRQYRLSDGVFLAAQDTVRLKVVAQGFFKGTLSGMGGMMILETDGHGDMAIASFGEIFTLDVREGKSVIVDQGHVMAWDRNLHYEIAVSTQRSWIPMKGIIRTNMGGEFLLTRFKGNGTVYVASRNIREFTKWMKQANQ